MDLSIITVTYQSFSTIDSCILSVVTNTLSLSYEHIIIDNGSCDGTIELIESGYKNFVKLIKNGRNEGFAKANNQGLCHAQGDFILFLNPDMKIHSGYLDDLLSWAKKQKNLGIASCKLIDHRGKPHPVLRPSKAPHLLPYLPAFLKLKPFFCSVHPAFFYSTYDDNKEMEVEIVRGAFMLIKKTSIEKNVAFDPTFFILFEDIDLCLKMRKKGLKIIYTPIISCIDYFGKSFEKQTDAWKYCRMVKSFGLFVKRWHHPIHLLWVIPVSTIGFLIRIPSWGVKVSMKAVKRASSTL
jgi:GT2 family glycosyltransferase